MVLISNNMVLIFNIFSFIFRKENVYQDLDFENASFFSLVFSHGVWLEE